MKTVTDAVRELGGVWPKYSPSEIMLFCSDDSYWQCTRAEFEAEAERLGYPRVTLRPGDYVWCEDISGELEYHQVAQAFMAAGCKKDFSRPKRECVFWNERGNVAGGYYSEKWCKRQLTPAQVLNATNAKQATDSSNNWHERGELPPVGTECEVNTDVGRMRCKILALTEMYHSKVAVFQVGKSAPDWYAAPSAFRPLRTDRERWVEAAEHLIEDTTGKAAQSTQIEIIHDAMLDGTLPTPGDNQ